MNAEEVIKAVEIALELSGRMEVVYLHPDPEGPAEAAIVRAGTPAWERLHSTSEEPANVEGVYMIPHDHIEPGMF